MQCSMVLCSVVLCRVVQVQCMSPRKYIEQNENKYEKSKSY